MGDIVYTYKNNLYLNITNRCPNNCAFCDINSISRDLNVDLILSEEPSQQKIIQAIENKISKKEYKEIVFCGGGEPLMRLKTLLEISDYIGKNYAPTIRLNTVGYPAKFYHNRNVARELKDKGVSSVNISLNTVSREKYNSLCHPKIDDAFQKSLEFVKSCQKDGLNTKISCVNYDVDLEKFKTLAKNLNVGVVIRQYSEID